MGQFCGNRIFFRRITLTMPENGDFSVIFRQVQFLIKPAFAMTMKPNTFYRSDLPEPAFRSGQLWVILSRYTDINNLRILI